MGTIFISHVEEDTALARVLATGLETAGYSTWYYQRDTVPGAPYLLQVGQAIEECGAVVLIVSARSLDSNQVTSEVIRAFEARKHFIPVLSGITDAGFKEHQPLWRQALAASTSIVIPPQGTSAVISRIVDGLKAMGIQPGASVCMAKHPAPTVAGYTPKHLADKILAARKTVEGERKQVTVLFADVSGFTSLSEKLDPEEVHQLISEVLVPISEEIHRYEGTITQFLGDGVKEYAAKLKPRGIEFDMHIGINSGLVMVGRIGDDLSMEYTAMGDTVNLASRLGSMAEPGTILASEAAHRLTEGYFDFRALGEIEVKGKKQPVKAYELLGPGKAKTRLEVAATRGLTPFVGRQDELHHLENWLERVKKGQGHVVGIVGEPGVGKSRLLLQMRAMLPQGDCTYLEGDCLHYGEAMPYLPFLKILRSYFNINDGEREYVTKKRMAEKMDQLDPRLNGILAPLHDILSIEVEDQEYLKLDAPLKRMRIFEGIRDLLLRERQDRLLVCAVEDIHWIDKSSEEFLGYLMGFMANARIMLLLLYRPEYTNPWTSKTYYSQISVDQLPLSTSAEMVQAMLHEGKAAPDLQELILSRAAGNPLFMEELTRSLLDQGLIKRQNGQYVLTVKPSDIQVPDTVQGIIAARMDRLEQHRKWTMQVASVVGREFGLRILQIVAGMGEEAKSHLLSLQEMELIYQKNLFPEPEYIFKHAVTQDVAYNSLLLKRRRETHERIGKAIEELYPDRLDESCEALAHHYSTAENWEKAFQYLRMSGEKALRYHRQALDTLGRLLDTEENKRTRLDITLSLYSVMTALNYPEGCLGILDQAVRVAEELGDRRASAQLCARIGAAHALVGNTVEALKYSQKAFDEAEKLGDEETVGFTAGRLCLTYFYRGEAVKVADLAARSVALLEKAHMASHGTVPEFDQYVLLLVYLSWAKGMLGDFEESRRLCDKAIESATQTRSQYSVAAAHAIFGMVAFFMGKPEDIVHHGREGVRLSEEGQMPVFLGVCWAAEGFGHYCRGDFARARECAENGILLIIQHRVLVVLSGAHTVSGLVSQAMGDLRGARRSLEEAVQVAHDNDQRHWEGQAMMCLGRLIIEEDPSQMAFAEQTIIEGLKMVEDLQLKPLQAWGHVFLGETYAIAGKKRRALTSLKRAHQLCQEMGMDYFLARTEKALEGLKAQ